MNTTALDPNALAANLQRATAHAAAATGSSSATSSANGSTLGSSDFLTLLVSELKNQDPTQPTDPTSYITQLAQVNSLEQLVDVNTQLTSLGGTLTTKTPTTTSIG